MPQSSSKDWGRDPEFIEYAKHVIEEMAPKLADSAFTVSLAPGRTLGPDDPPDAGDVKYWVELGASIMMDKPILVIAQPNQPLPERLVRVADEVLRIEDVVSPESQEAIAARLAVFAERFPD